MKKYLPLFLILVACNVNQIEKDQSIENSSDADSLVNTDTVLISETDYVNDTLASLLNNPFDLVAFKKKWGPSNSGGGSEQKAILAAPDTIGQFYRYFLFWKLSQHISSRPHEAELMENFVITVYKYGEKIGDFYDSNEELVMLKSTYQIEALGNLNWVGKSTGELIEVFGEASFEENNCLIYTQQQKTITAHLNNGQVDWFKYVKLNETVNLNEEIPDVLLKF